MTPRAEIARMRAERRAAQGIAGEGRPDLAAILIRSTDPESDARLLADFIGCKATGSTVALPGAQVRFIEGPATGLYGIAVRDLDMPTDSTEVLGMTVTAER